LGAFLNKKIIKEMMTINEAIEQKINEYVEYAIDKTEVSWQNLKR